MDIVTLWTTLTTNVNILLTTSDPFIRFAVVGVVTVFCIYLMAWFLFFPVWRNLRVFGKDIVKGAEQAYLAFAWIGWIMMAGGALLIEGSYLNTMCTACCMSNDMKFLVGVLLILFGLLINFRTYCVCFSRMLKEKLHS